MKPNHLLTSLLAATALFVASCSTSRMTQNNTGQDDVYNSNARAKEYIAQVPMQQYAQTDSVSDSYYRKSDPNYDMDYASRIDRFYYGSPWRSYFNDYYNFYGYNDFYGYNNFYSPYYSYGLGFGGFFGSYYNNFYSNYLNWGFYGAPYFSNYWGPYSYYNPYYGGGFYGGGFYGGGGYVVRNRDNNPRPIRGNDNGLSRANGSYMGGTPSRGNNGTANNRGAEMYNPTNSRPNRGGETGSTRPNTTESRPSRGTESQARPTRGGDVPSRPTYTPPPTQSSPPPSSSSGSSRGGSSSGGGGGRPTRGGR